MNKNTTATRLVGDSPALQQVLRAAALVAATDVPVLVRGESGTGKELLARSLHAQSSRAAREFVSVNCAALPEALAESLLYGHRRGAFTGAVEHQAGYVVSADGGTLFLDEVGELSLAVQAKLLRFLESGELQPVGQAGTRRVDVRVIAATNRDLETAVRAGRFREDLYYRLNVIPLELPPLREREGDVAQLMTHLTAELSTRHDLEAPRYSPAALARLQRYPWPGNVRELRNLCERMLVLFSGRSVEPDNLPAEIRQEARASASPFRLPVGGIHLDSVESELIRQALALTAGNRSQAARLLGLTRDTLLYRIKKYAIVTT
jgi:DNA-binding NtrC family response regulator